MSKLHWWKIFLEFTSLKIIASQKPNSECFPFSRD